MASDASGPPAITQAEQEEIDLALLRRNRIEVIVVLLLFFVPSLHSAVRCCLRGSAPTPFYVQVLSTTMWYMEVSAPVLYIMWRSGDGWAHFGIRRFRWISDLPAALAAYLAFRLTVLGADRMFGAFLEAADSLTSTMPKYHFARPIDTAQRLVLIASCVFQGFGEELVMRGFMIPRMESLFRSKWFALGISTLLFTSYHCYQGVYGLLNSFVLGLVFGLVFCWYRRLWPIALAHALTDYMGWSQSAR